MPKEKKKQNSAAIYLNKTNISFSRNALLSLQETKRTELNVQFNIYMFYLDFVIVLVNGSWVQKDKQKSGK